MRYRPWCRYRRAAETPVRYARRQDSRTIRPLAASHYRDPLLDYAGERARVPMQGLGIGQQKHWLAERVREARERADRAAQLDLFDYLAPIAG